MIRQLRKLSFSMGNRIRKLTPYTLETVLGQQVIAYIMGQTFKLQNELLNSTWGVKHAIEVRTGHSVTQTLVSRMLRGGQPSRDTRKRSDVIVMVNQDFIEDFVATFGSPGRVTRIYHGKSHDCVITDVPYNQRDFRRISLGDIDWQAAPFIESLLPKGYRTEYDDQVAAKRGCLTNEIVRDMEKLGINRDTLVESSIARAYEICLPFAQSTLQRLDLERQFREANPAQKDIPRDMFALVLSGIIDDAGLTIEQFAKNSRITNFADIFHNQEPIDSKTLQKIAKSLTPISGEWTLEALSELAAKRSVIEKEAGDELEEEEVS